MNGQWTQSVGCRWIVILLIDAISREMDREIQTIAMRGLIEVVASMKNLPFHYHSQVIDLNRIKEAAPFEGEGEIGWCFWKQGDRKKEIVDICECLLPIERMKVACERDWTLLIMRHKGVFEKILQMMWRIDYQRELNWNVDREIVEKESQKDELILQSPSFLMEYRSFQQLLCHTHTLLSSITPSYFIEHTQDEIVSIVEQAKESSQSEDGLIVCFF